MISNPTTTETLLSDQIERIHNSKNGNDIIDFINDLNKDYENIKN